MTDVHTEGMNLFKSMMPGLIPENVATLRDGSFADELGELSIDHVFGALWTRPGLDRRSRSLVTLGADHRGNRRGDLPHGRLRGIPGGRHRAQGRTRSTYPFITPPDC
jgi:hypothetical protein